MAEQKYRKNFITQPRQKEIDEWKDNGDRWKSIMYVDDSIVKGGFYFQGSWLFKASDKPYPETTHSHDADEYLGFVGTNPDDPMDLCGEVELYLDGEPYTITETTVVFIPGGVSHCPVYCRRADRPIWFFATFPEKMYVKKDNEEE